MAGCGQELEESSNCPVHKAGCLTWSSLYTGILKKQAQRPVREWNVLPSWGQSGKKHRRSFLLLCPYTHFHQKVWPRLNVCLPNSRSKLKMCVFCSQNLDQRHVFSCLKIQIKDVCISTSKVQRRSKWMNTLQTKQKEKKKKPLTSVPSISRL